MASVEIIVLLKACIKQVDIITSKYLWPFVWLSDTRLLSFQLSALQKGGSLASFLLYTMKKVTTTA